ncbi:MAG: hypothetical protein KGM95_08760, partial [Betaproteobacteria bacterium]|nr:hypothetical protein [Betaproteobacteria bacterium]
WLKVQVKVVRALPGILPDRQAWPDLPSYKLAYKDDACEDRMGWNGVKPIETLARCEVQWWAALCSTHLTRDKVARA